MRLVFFSLVTVSVLMAGCAATSKPPAIATDEPAIQHDGRIVGTAGLRSAIDDLLASPDMGVTTAAVKVVDAESGAELFSHNARRLMHPASNMKLLSTAAALHYLGINHQFETRVAVDSGVVISDTLTAPLYLVGGGDPDFSLGDMAELAGQLAAAGIRHIAGDLLTDDTYFDDFSAGEGWMWDDAGSWYFAPLSAFTVNENCVQVSYEPGDSLGAPAKIRVHPDVGYIGLINNSNTLDSLTLAELEADTLNPPQGFKIGRRWRERENTIEIEGNIGDWREADERVIDIVDAPAFFAAVFLEECRRAGISFSGVVSKDTLRAPYTVLASKLSAPLHAIAANVNKPSYNIGAELLLKAVGASQSGTPGSTKNGAHALNALLHSWNVDTTQLRIADGSGVSRYNLVSADALTKLLVGMYGDFGVRSEFVASLPVAGVDGSLSGRMKEGAAFGRVHAKTGSLSGVSALAGYTTSADGDVLAFSILMSHFVGSSRPFRAIQDQICDVISRYTSATR